MSEQFVSRGGSHVKSPSLTAYNYSYLNTRQIHDGEMPVFSGWVLIEDRNSALKGRIQLKERFAVLCPTRLLLYKRAPEKRPVKAQQALAVYPIVNSDFEVLQAPRLTAENLTKVTEMSDLKEISNLKEFLRVSFSEVAQVRDQVPTVHDAQKIHRDFYFGEQTNQWLYQLRMAKKAIHDSLNLEKAQLQTQSQ